MEEEEVSLVDGVFEGAFGALGLREFRYVVGDGVLAQEAPSSSSSSPWRDEDPRSENDTLAFDGAVQIDTYNLKKSMDIVESRKIGVIWSLELSNDGRESEYFGYFKDIRFSAGGITNGCSRHVYHLNKTTT
ncbi:hypothetical protein Tco_0085715 [Tanacetum coccineum]